MCYLRVVHEVRPFFGESSLLRVDVSRDCCMTADQFRICGGRPKLCGAPWRAQGGIAAWKPLREEQRVVGEVGGERVG